MGTKELNNKTYIRRYRDLPGPPGPGDPPAVTSWLSESVGGAAIGPQESDALAWLEGLPEAEADRALDTALHQWEVTPRVATSDDLDDTEPLAWPTAIEPVRCPVCGGVPWWDAAGGQHCERCDPPNKSVLVQAKAQHLRSKAKEGRR